MTMTGYDARVTRTKFLDLAGVARLVGVSEGSIRTYHTRATANRKAGTPKPGDLPEPDEIFGRSPVWKQTTIERFMRNRPGRGAGGGAHMHKSRREP
ncbi:excisionase [Gordonia phage Jace]|uniref:Excisionase n=1 Tax=Gordonia phage Jace TaxID=2182360 RepID=A0A2U8UJC0_9CAUD|nr:DNA binding protein [Gordonia phage Jace]AWN03710.1 excisionase [Gordonia phage Jace]